MCSLEGYLIVVLGDEGLPCHEGKSHPTCMLMLLEGESSSTTCHAVNVINGLTKCKETESSHPNIVIVQVSRLFPMESSS